MTPKMYFRVLSSRWHFAHFSEGVRNSFHGAAPGDWISCWQRGERRGSEAYSLNAYGGPYTVGALDSFFEAAEVYDGMEGWNAYHLRRASELDGLCVFTRAIDVLEYPKFGAYWTIKAERYLILAGDENGKCAEDESVLLKNWHVVEGPLTRSEFMSRISGATD